MQTNQLRTNPIEAAEFKVPANSPAMMQNRLGALMVLINSILFEVDAMKQARELAEHESIDFNREVGRFEADLIRCALTRCGGKQTGAAALLNLKVTTLNTKIKRLGIGGSGLMTD